MTRAILKTTLGTAGSLVVLALSAVAGCQDAATVTVGAASSASHVNAARLALEDHLATPDAEPVEMVFESEPSAMAAPALRTAHRLVRTPGIVAVVGHSNSAASLAAAPVYNDAGLVELAPTSTAVAYSEAGPYSFRMVPPDNRQGEFLARVLADSLTAGSRIALTYVNDDYGRGLRASTVAALEREAPDLELVLDLPHADNLNADADDAEYLVEAVAAAEPDVVLWLGRTIALRAVLPLLRDQLGRTLPIYGGDGLIASLSVPRTEEEWGNVRHVELADVNATPESRAWAERYARRFGVRPSGGEALSYDAMRLVLTAIADGARTGAQVRAYLESLGRTRPPYAGITGPIRFDAEGDAQPHYRLVRAVELTEP